MLSEQTVGDLALTEEQNHYIVGLITWYLNMSSPDYEGPAPDDDNVPFFTVDFIREILLWQPATLAVILTNHESLFAIFGVDPEAGG